MRGRGRGRARGRVRVRARERMKRGSRRRGYGGLHFAYPDSYSVCVAWFSIVAAPTPVDADLAITPLPDTVVSNARGRGSTSRSRVKEEDFH